MAERSAMGGGDALLLVDVQRDFCPGGSLPVPGGDRVVGALNAWIREAERGGALIVASRDWHPPHHVSFHGRGGPWPEHCVQGTWGADFHPDLSLPSEAEIVSKGQDPDVDAYSAFDGTDLASLLERRGIRRVFVGGLAQDVCVRATVLSALERGLETHLLVEGTLPVDPARGEAAREEMEARGAIVEGALRGG